MHTAWAAEKRAEMLDLWERHFKQHQEGFEMFTGPLYEDAAALAIGFNPGGELNADVMHDLMEVFTSNHPDRFSIKRVEAEGVHVDDEYAQSMHKHYLPNTRPAYETGRSNSDIPTRIRERLFNGKEELLYETVETNRFYMRSDGRSEHWSFLQGLDESVREEYERVCRETTRELIERTTPSTVIDFSNYREDAVDFCADLGLTAVERDTHSVTANNGTEAVVNVAELVAPPHSTVVSVEPHLSHPNLSSPHLQMLEETVPQYLPETTSSLGKTQ